jgi:hypothetical protein
MLSHNSSSIPTNTRPAMRLVSPDSAATMIELVVIIGDNDRHIVIHAMNARPHFLALLDHPGDTS